MDGPEWRGRMCQADKDDGVIWSYQFLYPYFREQSQGDWPPIGHLDLFVLPFPLPLPLPLGGAPMGCGKSVS